MRKIIRLLSGAVLMAMAVSCEVQEPASKPDPQEPQEIEPPLVVAVEDYVEEVNGQCLVMIGVEGGSFQMGATPEQAEVSFTDESPVHKVSLSSYYLSQTEVTKAQYKAVMQGFPGNMIGGNFPAKEISWEDAQAFCQKLSQLTGKHYTLPTEAQWEYAARGGKHQSPFLYSGSDNVNEVAWYGETEAETVEHPIALRRPNALGLFDMSGNVWEWCSDYYAPYTSEAQANPQGPTKGVQRVLRGGSWGSQPRYVRVSNRYSSPAQTISKYYGFRVAMIPQ